MKLRKIILLALIFEIICLLMVFFADVRIQTMRFIYLYLLAFGVYFFSLGLLKGHLSEGEVTKALVITFAAAIIFRLTLLPMSCSDDIYRYLWEGKVQWQGINPYLISPDSPQLAGMRDEFYAGINHKDLTTIYPPLMLMVFALVDFFAHCPLAMKITFVLFDLAGALLLINLLKLKGKPPLAFIIYAWNPLVLLSFAGEGHNDSLQIFFVVLALYFLAKEQNAGSIMAISLAVLSKFTALVLLPLFALRVRWKHLLLFPLLAIIFYLPYADGQKGLFTTLVHFGYDLHYNDSIHWLVYLLCGSLPISKVVVGIIFAARIGSSAFKG